MTWSHDNRPQGTAAASNGHASTSASRVRRRTAAADEAGPSTLTYNDTFSPQIYLSAASSSSTNTSNASRFSLSTSFVHLTARDIAFFDEVIDLLPSGSNDFASLKRAYNRLRGDSDYNLNDETDAFLWDTLLKLIKVRGKDWNTRWDAVRMAIGMEPRICSESDPGHTEAEGEEISSESDTVLDRQQMDVSVTTTHTPRASTTRAEIEALRKRMALLTAEAGSLVGSIARKAEHEESTAHPVTSILSTKEDRSGRAIRDTPGRQLRFAEQQQVRHSHKATIVESASDEDARGLQRQPKRQSSIVSEKKPATAQRQFDEVVARSRLEREAQKKLQAEQQEEEMEKRLHPLLSRLDRAISINLKRKCFIWWRTSVEQRKNRDLQMKRLRDQMILGKALTAWKGQLQRRRVKARGAEKVDVVRCKLRAWRVWRRSLSEARYTRREEKKTLLKGAFLLTRKKIEQRVVKESFLQWKVIWMEHRTAEFRTQHLVRGAFSLWRLHLWRRKSFLEKELEITGRGEDKIIEHVWERWRGATQTHSMNRLAKTFHKHRLLHKTLALWTATREEQASVRRREALADRWRARRMKRSTLVSWQKSTERIHEMQYHADQMRIRHSTTLQSTSVKIWMLREREQLFSRVTSASTQSQALARWFGNYHQLTSRLTIAEKRVSSKIRLAAIQSTFHLWREATRQTIISQHLASERDCRKVNRETFSRWREILTEKQKQMDRARILDSLLLRRKMWSVWTNKHIKAKGILLERHRNERSVRAAFTYWKARSAERKQEMMAIAVMRNKIEIRIQRTCLHRWTKAIIEHKSLLLEAVDRRDALLIRLVWSKWIDACLRHEDMWSLGRSFLDVKKEEHLRRAFVKWSSLARSNRNRRERVEQFLHEKKRDTATRVFDLWYDRFVEATMRPLEYEALLQRQRAVMSTTFIRWKGQTRSLPAVQLDQVRRKSHAFYQWKERLPLVRLQNKATKKDRLMMQEKGFRHWYAAAKSKRALRAAARFGGPSAVRLGAVAHLRQKSGGNPFGAAGSSSSPDARLGIRSVGRRKTTDRPRSQATDPITLAPIVRPSTRAREEQGSLRESDLIEGGSSDFGLGNNHHLGEIGRTDITMTTATMPPALQRWMQGLGQGRREITLEEAEASSEPPSSILGHRHGHERRHLNRTPSPPASQTHSEATMRVRNSPRRPANANTSMEWLRIRRRQQSKSMILDHT